MHKIGHASETSETKTWQRAGLFQVRSRHFDSRRVTLIHYSYGKGWEREIHCTYEHQYAWFRDALISSQRISAANCRPLARETIGLSITRFPFFPLDHANKSFCCIVHLPCFLIIFIRRVQTSARAKYLSYEIKFAF